jgi:hypothetical protein
MQQQIVKPKEEKPTVVPAALSHAPPSPKIEPQPIPTTAKPAEQKPAIPKPEQKPIPKETQILLHGLAEIEDILYAMRLQIGQLYAPEQNNTEDIAQCFPKELTDKLSFERIPYTEDYIIRPKSFLDKDVYNRIRDIVTDMGGNYDKPNHYFVVKRN